MRLIVLFLALPLVEIGLFVTVGGWLGLWPTLALVLASAVLGVAVLRGQGLRAMAGLQAAQAARGAILSNPLSPLAHNALIMLAGMLLLLPGFLSDAIGVLLLIPPLRRGLIHLLGRALRARAVPAGFAAAPGRRPDPAGDWVDAEFEEIAPDAPKLNRPAAPRRH